MPRNPDPNFTTEHVAGDGWLMRSWDSWYPMRKTPQGGLAYLNQPHHKHDGTKERARQIVDEYLAQKKPERGRRRRNARGDSYRGDDGFIHLKGEPDRAKLMARAQKPGNNIRTM